MKKQSSDRIESYRALLDQSYEFLGSIMSHDTIATMPYKELLYELERRRLYLESTKETSTNREMEKQLKDLNRKQK